MRVCVGVGVRGVRGCGQTLAKNTIASDYLSQEHHSYRMSMHVHVGVLACSLAMRQEKSMTVGHWGSNTATFHTLAVHHELNSVGTVLSRND